MFQYFEKITDNPVTTYRLKMAVGCPIPDTYLKGRPVYFGDLYLDGSDSFFESASYADTGEALTDNELDELLEQCSDYLVQQNFERYGYFKK